MYDEECARTSEAIVDNDRTVMIPTSIPTIPGFTLSPPSETLHRSISLAAEKDPPQLPNNKSSIRTLPYMTQLSVTPTSQETYPYAFMGISNRKSISSPGTDYNTLPAKMAGSISPFARRKFRSSYTIDSLLKPDKKYSKKYSSNPPNKTKPFYLDLNHSKSDTHGHTNTLQIPVQQENIKLPQNICHHPYTPQYPSVQNDFLKVPSSQIIRKHQLPPPMHPTYYHQIPRPNYTFPFAYLQKDNQTALEVQCPTEHLNIEISKPSPEPSLQLHDEDNSTSSKSEDSSSTSSQLGSPESTSSHQEPPNSQVSLREQASPPNESASHLRKPMYGLLDYYNNRP